MSALRISVLRLGFDARIKAQQDIFGSQSSPSLPPALQKVLSAAPPLPLLHKAASAPGSLGGSPGAAMAAEPMGRLETAQLMARLGRKLPPISRLYGIRVQPEDVARAEVGILRDRRLNAHQRKAASVASSAGSSSAAAGGYIALPPAQGGPRRIAAERQLRDARSSREDDDKPLTFRKLILPQTPVLESSSSREQPSRGKPAVPRVRDLAPTLPKPPTADARRPAPAEPERPLEPSLQSSEGMRLRKRYRIFVAADSPLWAERRAARAHREQELSEVSEDAAEVVEEGAAN